MGEVISPVTIKDIARQAGVSYATVSRVLNETDYPIRENTREKVMKAAHELGYTPNLLGRYLKARRSDDIGILIPNLSNPLFVDALLRIEGVLTGRRFNVLFCTSGRDRQKEEAILNNFLAKQVCGVILMDVEGHEELLLRMAEQGIVIAAVDGAGDYAFPMLRFSSDLAACGRVAAEHLISVGRKEIAYISGPLKKNSRRMLLEGVRKGLQEKGLKLKESLIYAPEDEKDMPDVNFDYYNGFQMAKRLIESGQPFDAVLTGNDMTAVGVLEALRSSGLRVPEEVSVMGCDNTLISTVTSPTLSTVETFFGELGAACAQALTDRLLNQDNQIPVLPTPQAIKRLSTAQVSPGNR